MAAFRSIILKKQDLGEADELVFFLARDLGWLRGVAKNSRKSRVRFGGHLEPFSLVDMVLRPRRKDDLVWIDDSQVVNGFMRVRSDVARVALAAYFLELASAFQPEGQPDLDLFDFLRKFLETLESSPLNPVRFMLDEIRLLARLGYGPEFDVCPTCGRPLETGHKTLFAPHRGGACHPECVSPQEPSLPLSPDTLALVRRGLQMDPETAERLKLSRRGMDELRSALSAFVRHLRGKDLNSLVFLEKTGVWRNVPVPRQ